MLFFYDFTLDILFALIIFVCFFKNLLLLISIKFQYDSIECT